jgi:hypothetical protein
VALVDWITHALAYQVGANRPAFEIIFLKQVTFFSDVTVTGQGFIHLKMVTPASQL